LFFLNDFGNVWMFFGGGYMWEKDFYREWYNVQGLKQTFPM